MENNENDRPCCRRDTQHNNKNAALSKPTYDINAECRNEANNAVRRYAKCRFVILFYRQVPYSNEAR
jgi:hypothetical protein